jgi:hypothetical protein
MTQLIIVDLALQPQSDHPGQSRLYFPPAILLELDLETRAGSPVGFPNPLNLPGEDK